MRDRTNETDIIFGGIPHKKQVILADVNFPYKFSIDRKNNKLFFCINADEFSDQSFHSVVLNLDTGFTLIVAGIRNGYASAVDQATGAVYLGGSNGIFKYNYSTNDVMQPALVRNIDIFDMYYKDNLYFVDTRTQNLHVYKNNEVRFIVESKGCLIQQFIIDDKCDLYYVNCSGLFVLKKGSKCPTLLHTNDINIRGVALDVYSTLFFVAKDGIYSFDKESELLSKVLSVNNGNGLVFDRSNRLIYCEDRSIVTLIPH